MNIALQSSRQLGLYLSVVLILLVAAVLAAAFGFIECDGWAYIHMAQALRRGQGCAFDGVHFDAFPCGYPMAIALTAPSADIASLMTSSKFTNFLLLSSGFLLLAKEIRNALVPAFVIINPLTLAIYNWTFSENLLLFAYCGAFFAIARLARGEATNRYVALLGLFLVVGCLSRYLFGPFAVVIFLAVWLAYGRQLAFRALPAFVAAGIFFLAYMKFNAIMAEYYGPSIERFPAAGTFVFLTMKFLLAAGIAVVRAGAALLVLLGFSFRHISFANETKTLAAEKSAYVYLAVTGAGYLFVVYVLRLRFQYDMYDNRFVAYGVVFILAALMGMFVRVRADRPFPVAAFVAYGLLSAVFSEGPWKPSFEGPANLANALRSVVNGSFKPPAQILADYRSPGVNDARVVFAFGIPGATRYITPYNLLWRNNTDSTWYYGEKVKVITPVVGPHFKPETLTSFTETVKAHAGEPCVFDFNRFPTHEEFKEYLDNGFPIDLKISVSSLRPQYEYRYAPVYDPQLKTYLLRAFEPGRYVPCAEILTNGERSSSQ